MGPLLRRIYRDELALIAAHDWSASPHPADAA